MNDKLKKYLPLGSVVLLKKAKKRMMITGFAVKTKELPDKIWDYTGCLYPEGMQTSDKNLLFDHSDIGTVYAIGYCDDEHKRYIKYLENLLNEKNQAGEKN